MPLTIKRERGATGPACIQDPTPERMQLRWYNTMTAAAHALGEMAEENPKIIENKNWQAATQGLAGLLKEGRQNG